MKGNKEAKKEMKGVLDEFLNTEESKRQEGEESQEYRQKKAQIK